MSLDDPPAHLTTNFGGPERLATVTESLARLRDGGRVGVQVISTSWYPVTAVQWQHYLVHVSGGQLDLGFAPEDLHTIADPGPGKSADKGAWIQEDMERRRLGFAAAAFADDSGANIATAAGVCNTLWVEARNGLTDTDWSYLETMVLGQLPIVRNSGATTATVGGNNDLPLVRKFKNSKKTNTNEDATCTMQDFLGTSQYTNCKGEETEVEIACATTDDAATTTTSTKICTYSEHPVQFDDGAAAATAVGCGDHGTFDPPTHFIRDPATGVCRLDFIALTSTCIGAPVVAGGKFGVIVEAPLSIGPGSHNHEQNEDNNQKDNSGLLLRFSRTGGEDYYNVDGPQETVPLHGVIPAQRKLQSTCVESVGSYDPQNYKHYCYSCDDGGCNLNDFCATRGYCWNSQGGACKPACSNLVIWSGSDKKQCDEPCKSFDKPIQAPTGACGMP